MRMHLEGLISTFNCNSLLELATKWASDPTNPAGGAVAGKNLVCGH